MLAISVVPMTSGGGAQVISKEFVSALSELGESHEAFLFSQKDEKLNFFLKWYLALRELMIKIRVYKPSVVISHLDGALFANAIAVRSNKIHLVHVFHGPPTVRKGLIGKFYELFKNLSLKKVDLLVFVSSAQKLEHLKVYPVIKNKKSIVLRNPFIPAITSLSASDDAIIMKQKDCGRAIFLLPGRLSNQKNQFFLIKLLNKRKKSGFYDLLLFAGDGEDREYLIAEASKYSLKVGFDFDQADSSDVLFLGHRLDVQALMKNVDIVLLPSLYEGFPLALVEALCVGAAVISSDCSTGPAEIKNVISEVLRNNTKLLEDRFIINPMEFGEAGLTIWCESIDALSNKSKNSSNDISLLIRNIFDRNEYRNSIRKSVEF